MVTRSEQILYGVLGIVFVTVYQGAVHEPLMNLLKLEADLANNLVGNIIVYLISLVIMFMLIKRVKKRRVEGDAV